jgi:nucleotide-binding universal stress UspA family protein
MGAEVTLLHVISDPVIYPAPEHVTIIGFTNQQDTNVLQMDSVDGLKNAAQTYLDKTKLHLGDKTIQILIKEGYFAESILMAAKKMHADVIVMGSHSQKWLENILMGSVTEKVLRSTSVPLFIVPTKKH